jgi:uncharacterized membrane protein HdeD (DUF308 family)
MNVWVRHKVAGDMTAGLARNWWAVGLRGVVTVAFALAVVTLLPSSTTASLVMLFAAYLAADGFFAVVAARRAVSNGRRWRTLALEGLTNLGLASWVLIWPAIAAVAFVHVLSIWAIVTGALMLAASHRLSLFHGRWFLAFAGATSTGWGILLATIGPDAASGPHAMALWLIAYAVLFGITLLVLGFHLRRRHHQSDDWAARSGSLGRTTRAAGPHRSDPG